MDASPFQLEGHSSNSPPRREFALFCLVLVTLLAAFFGNALRPGWVLSAADWLLATESFRTAGPGYEPSNRLLTDIACQMDPWMNLAAAEWRAGRIPLWNPYAGCGAPLLANAQSGVFYPINFIFFLTQSPYAWVAMAMLKLFVAGVGTFLLASELGLGRLGRWFAGLCFPFSGFVVVWLQYPMGGVAVWLPTILWLVDRLVKRPSAARFGGLALVLACAHLGGHPETMAHILLVAGAMAFWRAWGSRATSGTEAWTGLRWFAAAVVSSVLIAAVQIIPLFEYLRHSEAWVERSAEASNPLRIRMPQILSMPALAVPYIYGSYRRGHPHVEKALDVENFNEIAGGYTGLVTLAVLVPLAIRMRRSSSVIRFWLAVDLVSLAIAYRMPLVENLVQLIPVLNVTQNQRLLLVIALAHCLLGGIALDSWSALGDPAARRFRLLIASMLAGGAVVLAAAAIGVWRAGPAIEQRAIKHFTEQARLRDLPDDALDQRASIMAKQVLRFFPRYYACVAVYAALWAAYVFSARPGTLAHRAAAIIPLCLAELFLFGRDYNPAIPIDHYFPESPITRMLQDRAAGRTHPFRVLSLEEEFPPNVLGRYGIADLRNYDALEVRRTLDFFASLWPSNTGRRTSNSWTTWEQVAASHELLQLANVRYVISTVNPDVPVGGLDQFGRVHIATLQHEGGLLFGHGTAPLSRVISSIEEYRAGYLRARVIVPPGCSRLVFSETYMPGWRAHVDGIECNVSPFAGAFVSVPVTPGERDVLFEYSPHSFRLGLIVSCAGLIGTGLFCALGRSRALAHSTPPPASCRRSE